MMHCHILHYTIAYLTQAQQLIASGVLPVSEYPTFDNDK
jgi:hypothetical protein